MVWLLRFGCSTTIGVKIPAISFCIKMMARRETFMCMQMTSREKMWFLPWHWMVQWLLLEECISNWPPQCSRLVTSKWSFILSPVMGLAWLQVSYFHRLMKTRPWNRVTRPLFPNIAFTRCMMPTVPVLQIVRLHTNQYIFRNLCEKLEEGMCCSRDFLFTSQAHWNGHGRGEIPETGK
jgi:hypothetical protein